MVKKFPVDSNAAAQEKGLAAVLVFIELSATTVSGKYAEAIVSGIITKCLLSSKQKTKELASSIILMYIEAEKTEVVIEELVKGLDNKSPKIVSQCISLLKESLTAFGPKVVKPSPLIKIVLSKIEDRDKMVREETKLLAIAIYSWLKEAFKPQLSGLKPVQLSELETEFAKIASERPSVTRFLRSEQVRVQTNSGDANLPEVDGNAASALPLADDIDPFELLEPVDILPKLPADFYTMCEAKKWQDRKQALESLQELLTPNPKLAAGDYGELIKVLKKFITKDTNVMVVALAAKCLADLASRLRKAFHPYAHSCVNILLEKFKEKKSNVVVALREAIDAAMLSSNLEAIQEDVTTALDNKNPQIKAETASFLTRQFALLSPTVVGNKKLLKVLLTALIKTLSDMDGAVRDAAAEAIGTAMRVVGEKIMLPFLGDVDALKMTKIKESCEKAEVKYPAPPGGHPVARAAPVKATSASSLPTPRPSSAASSISGSTDDLAGGSKKPLRSGAKVVKPKSGATIKKITSAPSGVTAKTVTRPKPGAVAKVAAPVRGRGSIGGLPSNLNSDEPEIASPSGTLPVNDMKSQRFADEKSLQVLKWNFTTPRPEFYEQLKEQMTAAGWGSDLIKNCFNDDFKYHLKAIAEMNDFLTSGNAEATIANADLILKWAALRFFDTNPSVILKCLEFLVSLFVAYKDSDQKLTELEAVSFFPYLVLKTGDPKPPVQLKVKDILEKARAIYAPSKLFAYIMGGLAIKNARQRIACLEELALLVEAYGLAVCQPPHPGALKEIAKQISDRDNGVRNAALNFIVQIFYIEGEKVIKQVGKLSDKDMSMIEERLKRTKPPVRAPVIAAPAVGGIRAPVTGKAITAPNSRNTTPPKERTPPKSMEVERTPSPDDLEPVYQHSERKMDQVRGGTITKRKPTMRPVSLNVNEMEQQMHEEFMTSPSKVTANVNSFVPQNNGQESSKNLIRQELANRRRAQRGQLQAPSSQLQPVHAIIPRQESLDELLNLPDVQLPERRTSAQFTSKSPLSGSPAHSVAKLVSTSTKAEVAIKLVLANLSAQEIPATIEAFAQLRELLDRPEQADIYLGSKVDQIISMCSLQYRLCTTKHLSDDNVSKAQVIGLFKAITSILDGLFKHPQLKKKASREVLRDLMPQIITIILDPRLTESQEGPAIVKAVNVLATCIIINADPTNFMTAMIMLLSDCVAGSSGHSSPKFTEMVMKCIWKMVRFIDQCIDDLNIDKILLEVHQFMKSFPSDFWKSDTSRQDTPLRTIKTITYLLVQQKGDSIYDHLSLINDRNSSELLPYIQRALKQLSKGQPGDGGDGMPKTPTNGPSGSNTFGSMAKVTPNPYSKTQEQKRTSASKTLDDILAKLSNPEECPTGFLELFQFTVENANFDLKTHLAKSSTEYFESFVLDGLAKVRTNGATIGQDGDQNVASDVNGKTQPTNGNGTPTRRIMYQDSVGETPRIPVRSKLGIISGNTSIPTLRQSPRKMAQQIPQLPPADQMTKGDVVEWLKACTALLGKDPAKYQDPQFIDNMIASVNEKYHISSDPDVVDIQVARRMADDAQETLKAFKLKYNL